MKCTVSIAEVRSELRNREKPQEHPRSLVVGYTASIFDAETKQQLHRTSKCPGIETAQSMANAWIRSMRYERVEA